MLSYASVLKAGSSKSKLPLPISSNWLTSVAPKATSATNPANLNTLPPETHLQIFSYLEPLSGLYLGLTSKKFYQLYRAEHGTTTFFQESREIVSGGEMERLGLRSEEHLITCIIRMAFIKERALGVS
jgi:hypothetical protein